MDWEQLRERTLGEVGTSLVAEGAGVTGGFLLAGFVGRQVQDRVKSDAAVIASPTATNKIMAWGANNVPKLVVWYLLKKYTTVEPGEVLTPVKEATVDAKKAVAGSIVFDTLVRLSKDGINPAEIDLFGYRLLGSGSSESQKSVQSSSQADTQRLIQENSALRAELNKALQRLATPAVPAQAQPAPVAAPLQAQSQVVQQAPPPVIRYQPVTPPAQPAPVQKAAPIVQVEQRPPMVATEEVSAQPEKPRQPKYGFMNEQTPPKERQDKFAFMKGEKDIASMFGML
jgi:hypothetical protein